MTNEQLVARIKGGESVADNMLALWNANKGFINSIASKYIGGAELEDLEQESFIALCDAVDGFDSDRGMSFINYASFYLNRRFRACVDNNRNFHIPDGVVTEIAEYKKLVVDYEKQLGDKPSRSEIKRLLGVGDKKLDTIIETARKSRTESIYAQVSNDAEELTIADTIASGEDMEADVIERIDRERMRKEVWVAVDSLENEERDVIKLRYKENGTLEEIGKRKGVCASKVRTIQKNALKSLRSRNYRGYLKRYYDEYIGSADFVHVGVSEFSRTWTSSVEKVVIYNEKP